jgi:SAM-dependent methyltransferase
MTNETDNDTRARHLRISDPSPWVERFAPLIKTGGTALDLACGGGRHTRYLLEKGYKMVALDRLTDTVADLERNPACEIITADLEGAEPVFNNSGALAGRTFDGIIVVNYLHRELFENLIKAVRPGGAFIYETFARGNEVFTRPRNPDHLLKSGELLNLVKDKMQIVAYEHGIIEKGPIPGVIQRICAVRDDHAGVREDGEPAPCPVHPSETGPAK